MEVREEEFDLYDVVQEACQQLEGEIRRKGLVLTVENCHLSLRTDRRRLLQAVLNLVSNAMKYTIEGAVQVLAREDGGWAEITVRDTGIGIGEKDAELIFRPFSRIDSPLRYTVSGTGLGLYLTRKVVSEVLQGEVSFTSRPGVGSTFVLRVPASLHRETVAEA